jgi:hypothetical protein
MREEREKEGVGWEEKMGWDEGRKGKGGGGMGREDGLR